jgi:ABC-2 type transport system ATP-binding protein
VNSPTALDPFRSVESAELAPDTAIRLDRVGVRYRVAHQRITSLKEYTIQTLSRRIEHNEFWALRDVVLEIGAGETFGIVGRNGAGKSTLLKVIARILRPTRGRVRVRGRVTPMIALGAGSHPELTGRENIFLNGTLLGYSKAMLLERLDDIIAFAELGDFIDAPLRTYSTGMEARLGFAVGSAFRPDILILDEILSVGDEGFRDKCLERIARFQAEGTTTLFSSHSAELLGELCGRCAWLEDGRICALGRPDEVIEQYHGALGLR